jgi:molybdopterin/thiamine biosynthesis adenylyltransferase
MTRDFSRQSFLGEDANRMFSSVKVGIIGLCGGGSHTVQQLAHLGLLNYVLADPQRVDQSNLNRCVGATADDVNNDEFKADIAERVIRSINPNAHVICVRDKWQNHQIHLRDCAVIFGCVDSINEREQLDRFCRRYLIHYIDIGMSVVSAGNSRRIVGQVAISSPGGPCLRCMAIVSEKGLKEEAQHYGDAGPQPQVVWPNGVLASTSVGLFVQLVTPWHPHSTDSAYVEYNGNDNTLAPSPRLEYAKMSSCLHFPEFDLGDPFFNLEDIAADDGLSPDAAVPDNQTWR